MAASRSRFLRAALIPAAVFQSVIFGGAYGTGREIAEFVSEHGPWGGLLSLGVIGVGFGVILALSFELARLFRRYEYRGFLRLLIGPAWIAYELLFLVALVIVLAVNGAAAGRILADRFDIPALVGVALLFGAVVFLNYSGRELLEKSMSLCMTALTIVLVVFCAATLIKHGEMISRAFAEVPTRGDWVVSGLQYTLYNAAIVPVLLFCARDVETRGEAVIGGFVAGAMGAFPALVFHLTFMAAYPAVLEQALPTYWLIGRLASSWLMLAYILVLFGMVIQTVAGLLHGLNERLDSWFLERQGRVCHPRTHAVVAGLALIASIVLSNFGITALVAKGYGNLAWGYLLVYIIPLLTVGIYKILRASNGTLGVNSDAVSHT